MGCTVAGNLNIFPVLYGFTREILITLAANIETRELTSTTDDVECFFSVLTMKQVYTWQIMANNNEITRYLYTNHTVYTIIHIRFTMPGGKCQ